MVLNQIYNEDCFDTLNRISNNYIDMILSSPPYDDIRKYEGYKFDYTKYSILIYPKMKPGGCIIWVVGDSMIKGSESCTAFKQALSFVNSGFLLNDTMIYGKKNPMPTSGKRYRQSFEYIFCFSKGKPKTFNPIIEKCKYTGEANMKNRGVEGKLEYRKVQRTKEKKLSNIFMYSIGGGISTKDKIAYKHPAIMPEKLVEDQILTWSNENDIIYDPLFGSGTTLKIAKKLGRQYFGSEISKEYCEIARERLKCL